MFKLSEHGFPTGGEVGLQDDPKPGGVLRVDHLTLEVPQEEVAQPLVTEGPLEEEAS